MSLIIDQNVTLHNLLDTIDYTGKLGLENPNDLSLEDVQDLINLKKDKMRKLRLKEEEFNRNAALVPESDPDVALINDKIVQVKEAVEKASLERVGL